MNWSVFLEVSRQEQQFYSRTAAGAEQYHEQRFVYLGASVIAYDGHDSQTCSFYKATMPAAAGRRRSDRALPPGQRRAAHAADQALHPAARQPTPSGRCDLLLMLDQMILDPTS